MKQLGPVLLCLLVWPFTALCGSPVPTELYGEVDHALKPSTVLADPEAYRGRTVLLGGEVVQTLSDTAGVRIEVLLYRLDDGDRPSQPDTSLGRVVASGPGLDGARLQPGRLVTLVGSVAGRAESAAGPLPHLGVRFIHPWPTAEEEAAARQAVCPPGCCYDPWWGPCWGDPWCPSWYYGPYPRWRFGGSYYRSWH